MLDKVILNHLEEMDTIENEALEMVEKAILGISIESLIDNPHEVLINLADGISSAVKDEFYHKAGQNGLSLAHSIEKDGKILLPKKEPNANDNLLQDIT